MEKSCFKHLDTTHQELCLIMFALKQYFSDLKPARSSSLCCKSLIVGRHDEDIHDVVGSPPPTA